VWGTFDDRYTTTWTVLGGPVIGFNLKENDKGRYVKNMSIIIGDRCKPKYFGARKLAVQLGEKRRVRFYWQESI